MIEHNSHSLKRPFSLLSKTKTMKPQNLRIRNAVLRSNLLHFCSYLLVLLFSFDAGAQLPATVLSQLEAAKENWNTLYGNHVQFVSYEYLGIVSTETERMNTVNEISDRSQIWMPTGEIKVDSVIEPDPNISADKIESDATVTEEDYQKWKSAIDGLVKLGQHKVRINWKKGSETFYTIQVADNTTIVYDNMLSNVFTAMHQTVCLNVRIGWIWQTTFQTMTRGEIIAELNPKCTNDGKVITCDKKCEAFMQLGDAQIQCKTVRINWNCCQMEYTYGAAAGFKKLKFAAGRFKFEIEGILGSSFVGDASCTVCCPTLATPPSNIDVTTKCEGQSVVVNWVASSYSNFNKYNIESSADGSTWNTVERIDSRATPGGAAGYSYKDVGTGNTGNFYRITGELANGSKTYSKIIPTPCRVVQDVSLRPNPSQHTTIVRIISSKSENVTLSVQNMQGVELYRQIENLHIGKNEFSIDIRNYQRGTYTIRVVATTGQRTYRFIKN